MRASYLGKYQYYAKTASHFAKEGCFVVMEGYR